MGDEEMRIIQIAYRECKLAVRAYLTGRYTLLLSLKKSSSNSLCNICTYIESVKSVIWLSQCSSQFICCCNLELLKSVLKK